MHLLQQKLLWNVSLRCIIYVDYHCLLLLVFHCVLVGKFYVFVNHTFDIDHLVLWSISLFRTTLAERMMHMSQRLTLTARRSSRFRGHPARIEIFGRFCKKLLFINIFCLFFFSLIIFQNQNFDIQPELRSAVGSAKKYFLFIFWKVTKFPSFVFSIS